MKLHMLIALNDLHDGHLDAATDAARQGRAIAPDYGEVWLQSAEIAIARGDFDEAKHDLDKAMEIQPSFKVISWRQKLNTARAATQSATQPAAIR